MYINNVDDLEKAAVLNGEVTIDGVRYILTGPAYLDYDSRIGESVYHAYAVTNEDEDSRYTITWEIINPDCDDESCACDWDAPAEIWDSWEHKVVY